MIEDPADFWVMEQVLAIISLSLSLSLSLSSLSLSLPFSLSLPLCIVHTHGHNESRTDPIKLICQVFVRETLPMNKVGGGREKE
jgi:hypothetical protein